MRYLTTLATAGVVGLLGACSLLPAKRVPPPPVIQTPVVEEVKPTPVVRKPPTLPPYTESTTTEQTRSAELFRGDGRFVNPHHPTISESAGGEITLNFEDTDLQEVVKIVLGDLLNENYVIAPAVAGTVTLQSSHPLSKADLIPILETVLRMNDMAMVHSDGLYKILPAAAVAGESLPPVVGTQPGLPRGGFRTQVVPMRYVAAVEMEKLLAPFFEDIVVQVDKNRNLLILAGTQRSINRLLETIRIFDVDWLQGMSIGLVPLNYVEAQTVVEELEGLLITEDSPLTGVVRLLAIERLNSVLIITQQPRYLDEISQWVERLDRSDGKAGQRLYVYRVQNGKAADIAGVLNGVFGSEGSTATSPTPELAPGLEPVRLESPDGDAGETGQTAATSSASFSQSELTLPSGSDIRIIADEVNNALVILASPQDYALIEDALRRLDIIPLQVLIEATIVEITLSGDFSLGVQWFFRNRTSGNQRGIGTFNLGPSQALDGLLGTPPTVLGGFSYFFLDSDNIVRGLINTLASENRAKILSSPSLMVLDNHTASINVGDEVPVPTQQLQSTLDNTSPLVNTIEYRETGVSLEVTPRVNASGLIAMEIKQEVTSVVDTTTSGIDAPTFPRRAIETSVAVQSGNTIVLGGLIEDERAESESGIPGLYKIPLLGRLFGNTSEDTRRRELLVLITPRAVRSEHESREVTEEFRRKLQQLTPRR